MCGLSHPSKGKNWEALQKNAGISFSTAGPPPLREATPKAFASRRTGGQVPDVADFNRVIGGISGEVYFGASESTIFSKHGSPRSGSQNGNFSWP
jgi:hypothetical protein